MCVLITDPGSVWSSLMRPTPAGRLSARLLWSVAHGQGITLLTHRANGATGQKTHTHTQTCLNTHKCGTHAKCKFKKYTYTHTHTQTQLLTRAQSHKPLSCSHATYCVRPFHPAASVCAGLGRLSFRPRRWSLCQRELTEKGPKLRTDTQPNSRD